MSLYINPTKENFKNLLHFCPVCGTIEVPQTGWLSGGSL